MYTITLINLSADARSIDDLAQVEQRDLGEDALRERLSCFCAIDPLESAGADAEIRVQVRRERYLVRAAQGKLILYDMSRRELPAQILTVEEVLRELNGTALAARDRAVLRARADAGPGETGPVPPVAAPAPVNRKPRVLVLSAIAGLLAATIFFAAAPLGDESIPPGFAPLADPEREELYKALTGVYMTGSEPGQHGIVVSGPGELKLFELAAVEAPRVVYASYQPGRIGGKVVLATDQLGGLIDVPGNGNLEYCGEIYRRLP